MKKMGKDGRIGKEKGQGKEKTGKEEIPKEEKGRYYGRKAENK